MFATLNNPAAAYTKVGLDVKVETADSHKLILMLYEGARTALAMALHEHQKGNVMEMSKFITKAVDIISQGLLASLDLQAGGELAQRLASLYDYMCLRLRSINFKGDDAVVKEVDGLLAELKGAWEEIASDPAVVSGNKSAA